MKTPNPSPWQPATSGELALLSGMALLILLALFGPVVHQPADYHQFADGRLLAGVPHAMDVLSNLPFALAGMGGLWLLARHAVPGWSQMQCSMAGLFFGGLVLTCFASGYYHLHPDDQGLSVDRVGMVVAFAGLLGLAAAERISARAALMLATVVLVLGPLSVGVWARDGQVWPWMVLQFGGMALVVCMATLTAPVPGDASPVRWLWVMLAYALAKAFEMADLPVFELTGHVVSGHSLKHVLAACAAWPVGAALLAAQSAPAPVAHAEQTQ